MRAVTCLALLFAALTAGCAEGPFVDLPVSQTVEKPADPIKRMGSLDICYNTAAPWAEVAALAAESCAKYGAQATLVKQLPWQCRVTAPHRAQFTCDYPGTFDAKGRPIRPSDAQAIEDWTKRTGKSIRSASPTPGAATGIPNAAAAPSPLPTLTPADVAGKPPPQSGPLPVALPPVQPALAPSGFTLEPGSWGQSFEDR